MTTKPDFIPGEMVNLNWWPPGDSPGVVVGIRCVAKIEVRWTRPDGTPYGMTHLYDPEDLRHGE